MKKPASEPWIIHLICRVSISMPEPPGRQWHHWSDEQIRRSHFSSWRKRTDRFHQRLSTRHNNKNMWHQVLKVDRWTHHFSGATSVLVAGRVHPIQSPNSQLWRVQLVGPSAHQAPAWPSDQLQSESVALSVALLQGCRPAHSFNT